MSPGAMTVAILILSDVNAGFAVSEIYGAVRRPLERHTALKVAPLETIGLAERDAALRACAGDAACFVRRVRTGRSDVDLLLAVSVDRPPTGEGEVLLGLRLIDARERTQIGATGEEVSAGMSLERVVEARLPDVVPSEVWDQVARARIESDPSGAEVALADQTCVTPCVLERLFPGRYELFVRGAGSSAWQQEILLEAGQTTVVRAELEGPGGGNLLESPWFWAAVGVGVVATGVAGYFLLQSPEREVVLCLPGRGDPCP